MSTTMRPEDGADGSTDDERVARLRDEIDGLREALETRAMIGQALGMFMERYQIDAQHAWALLVRISQQTNTPVRVVAGKMTSDVTGDGARPERDLPGAPQPAR